MRRGGRKRHVNKMKLNEFKIYHNNIRGFNSKRISLESILSSIQPNIVTLNETRYRNQQKVEISGYPSFCRNRKVGSGGGIATAVRDDEYEYALKVGEGENNDEFLITRHSQFQIPVNIINIYGESESRCKVSEVEERWHRIALELKKIENKREVAIVIGDLNKHLGLEIKDNRSKISPGGKVVIDFLREGNYILLNGTNKVKNGPFTRYDPSCPFDDSLKSCLDLVILSRSLLPFVSELIIDKDMNFTPCHPIAGGKMSYTDHYGLLLILI